MPDSFTLLWTALATKAAAASSLARLSSSSSISIFDEKSNDEKLRDKKYMILR